MGRTGVAHWAVDVPGDNNTTLWHTAKFLKAVKLVA